MRQFLGLVHVGECVFHFLAAVEEGANEGALPTRLGAATQGERTEDFSVRQVIKGSGSDLQAAWVCFAWSRPSSERVQHWARSLGRRTPAPNECGARGGKF